MELAMPLYQSEPSPARTVSSVELSGECDSMQVWKGMFSPLGSLQLEEGQQPGGRGLGGGALAGGAAAIYACAAIGMQMPVDAKRRLTLEPRPTYISAEGSMLSARSLSCCREGLPVPHLGPPQKA